MTDSAPGNSTPNYTIGHGEDVSRRLSRRNLEKDAAYILSHLEPGMRVLDVGCGPGSISVGLAAAVSPGEFHGIDMSQSQIDFATSTAQENGLSNAQFQVADVIALPFPDNHFDVVHCSAVLMHVPDTQSALTEILRVLRSGGIFGANEPTGVSFIEPDIGNSTRLAEVFSAVLASNGGHPNIGKELKGKMFDAGFVDIEATGMVESFCRPSDPGEPTLFDSIKELILGPIISGRAIDLGIATQAEFDQWNKDFLVWQDSPGVFCGVIYGQIVGRKP